MADGNDCGNCGGYMEIWKAAILGVIQGLTEFLPVSSSGHLLLFERILGVETGGADMFLGVMLHAGTLAAVLAVYVPALWEMLKSDRKRLAYLLLATLPAALVGVILGDYVDELFFGGDWLWLFFALTAVLLLVCERRARQPRLLREINAGRALAVGGAQALAVIPGLSRSGTTLAAGVLCGLSREESADFSFLMSIPIIAGAIFTELFKAMRGGGYAAGVSWQCLAVGGACAAVFGFLSIQGMLRAVKGGKLTGFAVYLFLLAAVLVVLQIIF